MAFSCLLLDFKFLMFFRAFELFGVYFVIIIAVAKRIASFLFVLLIILLSFAHAFLILLKPRKRYSLESPTLNGDPNNPWNLNDPIVPFDNGNDGNSTIPILVQQPGTSTNMFTEYKTSLFSMFLYLTGIILFF